MGIFEQFPYTNFHDLNLDWILRAIQSMDKKLDEFVASNVLSYADPIHWDIETQYAKNTVVIDPKTGTAYMSINPVPVGQLLTNKYYWQPIFNYDEIVNTLKKQIAAVQADQHDTIPVAVGHGDLVWVVNKLYRLTKSLAAGSKIIENENAVPVTVEDAIINIDTTKNITRNTDGTITDTAGTITRNSDNIIDTANDAISVSGKTITNVAADSITNSSTNITDTASAGITRNASTITDTATDDVTVSGKNITNTASAGITRNAVTITDSATGAYVRSGNTITDTATGDVSVIGKNIINTADNISISATEDLTENANDRSATFTNDTEKITGNKKIDVDGNYTIKFPNKTINAKLLGRMYNVKDYGAKGDGASDDYAAFKSAVDATMDGDTIYVPYGKYVLSQNPYPISNNISSITPTDYTGYRRWIIASGSTFTGAGVGDPTTGKGTFNTPFSTNPWLIIPGNNVLYNLNNISCPQTGAIAGDSKELAPIEQYNTEPHRWYALEYRGSSTGDKDFSAGNVEILNQVLNITGTPGIATEIDVNNYTTVKPHAFSTGLFIVGGGSGNCDMTAIDVNRDPDSTHWVTGMTVRSARVGYFVESFDEIGVQVGRVNRLAEPAIFVGSQQKNGADGIVLKRFTDTNPTGNLMVFWGADEQTELFRIDAEGNIFSKGRPLNEQAAISAIRRETFTTTQQNYTEGEHTINVTVPSGYKIGMIGELSTIGFVSTISITETTNNSFKVYINSAGTGSIRYSILFIPA